MPKYPFISKCPSCTNRTVYSWVHNKCGSYEDVWNDGDVQCRNCGIIGKIWELVYKCGDHNDYRDFDHNNVNEVMMIIGSHCGGGPQFAIDLLQAYLKR